MERKGVEEKKQPSQWRKSDEGPIEKKRKMRKSSTFGARARGFGGKPKLSK